MTQPKKDLQQSLVHILALTMVDSLGPKTIKQLISYCGGVEAIFETSIRELSKIPSIGKTTATRVKTASLEEAEKMMETAEKLEVRIISFYDEDYPIRLKQFDTSPMVLYTRGNINFNHPRTVGIVGTRTPTERGRHLCEKLVRELLPYDVQVISGLAFGIDTYAHKAALQNGIETIGVLGHGVDTIHPACNRDTAKKMMVNGGLISEFPLFTPGCKENFPMRNRIVASMSDLVVIVESKERGGSMITAEFANTYHKDVFAFPGRVDDEVSQGCNKLIKIHKAHLLQSAEDIAYIMRWEEMDQEKSIQTSLFYDLNDTEQLAYDTIKANPNITVDSLNTHLKLTSSDLANMLLALEFKGIIRSLPGKKYVLN